MEDAENTAFMIGSNFVSASFGISVEEFSKQFLGKTMYFEFCFFQTHSISSLENFESQRLGILQVCVSFSSETSKFRFFFFLFLIHSFDQNHLS